MIDYATQGAVATALLNRPEKLNAMPRSFWAELREVVGRADRDPEVRVLIIQGAGRCFSVGGDIGGFAELRDAADRRTYLGEALSAFRAVEASETPTIAAVHGNALGGGCELTMVCDIVVADVTARFGTPEAAVGLVPGLGVVRGQAHVNLHWMKYMVLTGEPLTATQAQLAGLVNTVTPEGEHLVEARRLADRIATNAPLALTVGKQILGRHSDDGYAHGIDAVAFLQGTEDQVEGIAAFTERRAPQFKGR